MRIKSTTHDSITIEWTSTGANLYGVYLSDDMPRGFTNITEFTIPNLESGNRYNISIVSCEEANDCNEVSNYTLAITSKYSSLLLFFKILETCNAVMFYFIEKQI